MYIMRYLSPLVILAGWMNDAIVYSHEPVHRGMGEMMPGYWLQVTGGVNFAQKIILYFIAAWILTGLYWSQKQDSRKVFWMQFCVVCALTLAECGFRCALATSDGNIIGGRFEVLYMDLGLFGLGSTTACAIAPLYGLSTGAMLQCLAQRWPRK